jgi:hypothetical protein
MLYGFDGMSSIIVVPSLPGESALLALVKASIAHDEQRWNDRLSFFVIGTVVNAKLYMYPLSAVNADAALSAAQALHAAHGLPVNGPWKQL